MIALVRMRLAGFVRGGRALPPLLAGLVLLGVLHGGGQSTAAAAYGYSAAVLFPVFAWLTKVVLDTEPDVQRRLARVAVGPIRESLAGAVTALLTGLLLTAAALIAPLPFGAIRGPEPGSAEPSTATGAVLGLLAHLVALAAGVGLGALGSRAVTRTVRAGVTVLAVGSVLGIVLGLRDSVAPWLVPPVLAFARALGRVPVPAFGTFCLLAAWALAWCGAVFGTYLWLRRHRA
ncbi:hypothetical protein [Actinoplanes sp. NPDC051859]|uniref:hypothetical protein n=1 Tax=Actinoplanes sp. NPDC051859 TaxID=3363909 RepID=UPI0037AAF59E